MIGKDILNNELRIGDYVAYSIGEYNSLQIAKISKQTLKRIALRELQIESKTFVFNKNLTYIGYNEYRFLKIAKEEIAMYKMRLAAGI